MDKEIERIEKIERYLNKTLVGEELQHLERQLKYDPILQKAITDSVEIYGDQELLKTLNKEFDNYQKDRDVADNVLKRYLYLGGLGLVVILSLLLVFTNREDDYADVVKAQENLEMEELRKVNAAVVKDEDDNIIEIVETENKDILVDDNIQNKFEIDHKSERHFKPLKSFDIPVIVITTQVSPKYKFDNSTLHICGLNNVSLAKLNLVQHNHDLFLFHDKTYYRIKLVHDYEVLKKMATPQQHNILQHATGNGIQVEVIKTNSVQREDSDEIKFHVLEVRDLLEETNTKYKFIGRELVINENLYNKLHKRFKIYYIENTDEYYLRFKKKYYHLDHNNQDFTELVEEKDFKILESFHEQEDIKTIKYLKLEDIQSMYGN